MVRWSRNAGAARPVRRAVAAAAAAVWVALGGACAHLGQDPNVCPEFRDLRCATAPQCSMDERRGCRVCVCGPPPGADREGRLPSGVPPDRQTPQR